MPGKRSQWMSKKTRFVLLHLCT